MTPHDMRIYTEVIVYLAFGIMMYFCASMMTGGYPGRCTRCGGFAGRHKRKCPYRHGDPPHPG